MNQPDIELNIDKNRFQTIVDGHPCELGFELTDGVIHINHVRVPKAVGGRGIAGELTRHALDHARAQGWKVVPNCPYVKTWIDRHREYAELVA
ncbi:N-acetyltransferase [Wenzhouxiangella sp. AB-CW3]|uniref:GNAT family N-acetyltransferase n=1 Tax=Wenzhouxiangella sp. AB-CW3 TaxID=2771012 RepID=UPI00168BE9EB|nr:GNAT family N-acetyltransferase [Wenzhouxiangella sp. AB-CW3]QOC23947.1 N-acetyltransferase [Wenzhouxiangella sp. AB-CW3]